MARVEKVTLIDDTDGDEAAGTVRFGLDGKVYEIDLSAENTANLRGTLAAYIRHARRAGTLPRTIIGDNGPSTPQTRRGSAPVDTVAVRLWARKHGIQIKDRGRVPADVIAKYRQATGK